MNVGWTIECIDFWSLLKTRSTFSLKLTHNLRWKSGVSESAFMDTHGKGVSWLWLSPLWWTLWHFGRCWSLCRASEALHIFGTQTAPVGASHSGATTLRPAVDFCRLKIEGRWKWVSKREATANGNVGEVKASLEDKGYNYDILFNHQNSYSPRCRAKLQEQN